MRLIIDVAALAALFGFLFRRTRAVQITWWSGLFALSVLATIVFAVGVVFIFWNAWIGLTTR